MNPRLVLVAEDDADIRDMLTVTLESAGYHAVGAKDGSTAARILAVAQPVGLITDVLMPALNGIELCRLARLDPAVRDTAIVMVSGNSHRYDIEAGLAAGADRYLPKPLRPHALVAELRQVIGSRTPRTSPGDETGVSGNAAGSTSCTCCPTRTSTGRCAPAAR